MILEFIVRIGEHGSHVCVKSSDGGTYICAHCSFVMNVRVPNVECNSRREMIAHLLAHRHSGHRIPQYVFERVKGVLH